MTKVKAVVLIAAATLMLVAVGSVVSFKSVLAQAPTPQAADNPLTPDFQKGNAGDSELASALGITLEKLQAAYQTANIEALKDAASKGLITQAQADQFSANGQMGRSMHGFVLHEPTGVDYDAFLAKALGITTDALQAARQQVETARLDAEVKSGRLTQAQADLIKARQALFGNEKFQAGMKTAFEAGVSQAVTDGVITQSQADEILKENTGFGFPGGHGGFGGLRGRGGHGAGK